MLTYIRIFFSLFAISCLATNAGELKPKVTWGPEYYAPKKHFPVAFLGNLNSGFIQISHQPGKMLTIQLFTPKLGLKSEKSVELKSLPKDYDLQDCVNWGSKYYLFYSTWTKKETSERLFVQEIDVQKGVLVGASKELISCPQVTGDVSMVGFYRFHTSGKFKLMFSNDSANMSVFVNYRPQDRKEADQNAKYGFWVFDKDFKTVWSEKENTMPYGPKKMEVEDYTVDKHGDFLFLASVYNDDSGKKIIDNSPNFHFELIKFGNGSKKPSIVPLNLTDKYVSQIALFEDLTGHLVCSGYYASRDKKGKLVANGANVDGTFFVRLNDSSTGFENIHKGYYELPSEVLKQFESERTQKKLEKKEDKGENLTEQNLKLRRIIFNQDGSLVVMGEESYYVTVQYYNGKYWVSRTTYYRNDIFVQYINKDGELMWSKKIPKAQQGGSTMGFSFRVSEYNNDYYFLFMDNPKNTSISSNQAPAPFGGGYGGVLSCVRVDAKGEMKKNVLFDCKKLDQLITLEQGDWLDEKTFVISSVMGTNGPNDRNKLCLIKFE